jgi:serine/threonine kinase PknH
VPGLIANQPPDDVADLLPAAWYEAAERAQVPRRHRVLGFALLLIAVGISLAMPVAGAIVITAGITALRAADRAGESLAARRAARGARGSDPFWVLAWMPWMLLRAVIETVLLAPLVLLAAAVAVVAAMAATGGGHLALAVAAIAAGYGVICCLGPRSRAPRRQLNRCLDVAARTPLTVAMVALVLGTVAVAVMSLTVPGRPDFWPARGVSGVFLRLHQAETGPCPPPPPAMRLTTLCAPPSGTGVPGARAVPRGKPG